MASSGPDFWIPYLVECLEVSDHTDLTIRCSGSAVIKAHRAVLAAVSPFLKKLFLEVESDNAVVLHLPDVPPPAVESLLRVAYVGIVSVEASFRDDVMALLESLQVSDGVQERENDRKDVAPDSWPEAAKAIGSCSLLKVGTKRDRKASFSCLPEGKKNKNSACGVTVEFLSTPPARGKTSFGLAAAAAAAPSEGEAPYHDGFSVQQEEDTVDSDGFIQDKELADRKTRRVLQLEPGDEPLSDYVLFTGPRPRIRQQKCQCPYCLIQDDDLPTSRRDFAYHVCHYADCMKKYKKTSHLRAHLRWHVGDQPFQCPWENCGKRFTRSDELHRHHRIHTGEKNHRCQICGKCFARSDHLKKHLDSHGPLWHKAAGEGSTLRQHGVKCSEDTFGFKYGER